MDQLFDEDTINKAGEKSTKKLTYDEFWETDRETIVNIEDLSKIRIKLSSIERGNNKIYLISAEDKRMGGYKRLVVKIPEEHDISTSWIHPTKFPGIKKVVFRFPFKIKSEIFWEEMNKFLKTLSAGSEKFAVSLKGDEEKNNLFIEVKKRGGVFQANFGNKKAIFRFVTKFTSRRAETCL